MKKRLKIIGLVMLIWITFQVNASAQQDSLSKDMQIEMLQQADKYFYGKGVEQNYLRAYSLYYKAARYGGNAYALNALGVMRRNGLGVERNDAQAYRYFYESAQKGYPAAMFNIGRMYKEGTGRPQNLERAFQWFEDSDVRGYPLGYYATGYAYYKGFGVMQSYGKAVEKFTIGAQLEDMACMYFLGLCYLNGYGVPKNKTMAIAWFKAASEKGLKRADMLLERITTSGNVGALRSAQAKNDALSDFDSNADKEYKISEALQAYEGTWSGESYLLDWSGKDVLGKCKLELQLMCADNTVSGKWIQNDSLVSFISGDLKDSVIVFNNTGIYGKTYTFPLEMKQAEFRLNKEGNTETLFGKIASYSEILKEPYRPNVIYLTKKTEATGIGTAEAGEHFEVSPNPFSEYLRIVYHLPDKDWLTAEIYSTSGLLVAKFPQGECLGKDEFLLPLPGNMSAGPYILKIMGGKQVRYRNIIIKK
ncbi:MAG: T9SS type A sorting domain-containing protein [Candidatus Azobacteroides sp.]|nr:T9SS type A sorting domain-containing protein [Candidatus Azobacteroides sp.]